MNARTHPTLRTRLLAGIALVVAIGFALPAMAARLVHVRAGAHEKFTRVVFELDASSGYRIENVGTKSAPALRVTLEAGTKVQNVRAHGDVRSVKVAPGTRTVAQIRLRRSDLRIQEMILSNPHRIVLDLFVFLEAGGETKGDTPFSVHPGGVCVRYPNGPGSFRLQLQCYLVSL